MTCIFQNFKISRTGSSVILSENAADTCYKLVK